MIRYIDVKTVLLYTKVRERGFVYFDDSSLPFNMPVKDKFEQERVVDLRKKI